jgi:ComF family protein
MAEDFIERDEFKLIDGLVPIPLHPQRERERGYNQAELLSLALGTATGTPLLPLLSRPRGAKPSWQLGRIERQAELSGAFRTVEGAGRIALGRRLVLIDDVCATGTTLEECAAALRRSGAKDVTAYVFSRAGRLT